MTKGIEHLGDLDKVTDFPRIRVTAEKKSYSTPSVVGLPLKGGLSCNIAEVMYRPARRYKS